MMIFNEWNDEFRRLQIQLIVWKKFEENCNLCSLTNISQDWNLISIPKILWLEEF